MAYFNWLELGFDLCFRSKQFTIEKANSEANKDAGNQNEKF